MAHGFLEQFNVNVIAGWIPIHSGNDVHIVIDNSMEFTLKANIDRADLKGGGYGFSFNIPLDFIQSREPSSLKVSVFYGSDKAEIQNSPQILITDPQELNKVLVGKEGWLFLINDSNHAIDYTTGIRNFPTEKIISWKDLILKRKLQCEEMNIKYLHLICPEKDVACNQYLPEHFNISDNRPIIKLLKQLDYYADFIYPDYTDWEHGYDQKPPFTKGDTHWSFFGAYHATKLLLDRISLEFKSIKIFPLENYQFKIYYQASDLQVKTQGTNVEPILYTSPINKSISLIHSNGMYNTGRVEEYLNSNAAKVKVMVYHTSSIDWMKPFLNDSIGRIRYIWGRNIDWSEVKKFTPDVLLFQSNERFLTDTPSS